MRVAIIAAGALALASPAVAQEVDKQPSIFDGDYLSVGVGVGYEPSYIGSNDYIFYPTGIAQGSFHGIGLVSRTNGVALDFIPNRPGKVGLDLGIAGDVRLNRTQKAHDPVVDRLGTLDAAIEVGPTIGVTIPHLLSDYDSLSIGTDVLWDVSNAFGGMEMYPHISYQTPLSRGILASVSVSGDYGDDKFADYYFSITPAGSVASGLPEFHAKGGFNQLGTTLFVGVDLDGNLANGGFALFGAASYTRVLGDAKRSPLTSMRGSADQWFGTLGVGYTF
ncbi:MAG TPA: MipA/OmpV family protein [Croceibacterium sp.]|nr:MipA/OmpV family protein [Croceibacterium sp.]